MMTAPVWGVVASAIVVAIVLPLVSLLWKKIFGRNPETHDEEDLRRIEYATKICVHLFTSSFVAACVTSYFVYVAASRKDILVLFLFAGSLMFLYFVLGIVMLLASSKASVRSGILVFLEDFLGMERGALFVVAILMNPFLTAVTAYRLFSG